mmetsp:Transcript_29138/g.45287  ORF Transcript_29138/g.45287 Transcript_29138/m.45287 type:complete len:267 (-) Transcript_29138:3188-3988(-)
MVDSDEEYEPEYEWEKFRISKDHSFSVLCVVPPPLEYMAMLHTEKTEISGRQVWTGSLLACRYLIENPHLVEGKRVLELGAGTGVLGMLSHNLNSKCVALTDGDPLSVEHIHQNLTENNISGPIEGNSNCATAATHLLWGDDESMDSFSQWSVENLRLQNRSMWDPDERIQFDTIIAGDVMYKKELPSLFFRTVSKYLAFTDGELLLCHVPRSCVDHNVVKAAASEAGFAVEEVHLEKTELIDDDIDGVDIDDARRAALYRIMKRV